MKKLYFVLFFITLLQTSYSQDTLVYADGSFHEVKITSIDTLNRTVQYIRKNTNCAISLDDLIAYKHNEKWYSKEGDSGEFSVSENSLYQLKPHFFVRPAKHTYSKYSISVGYSPASADFGNLERRLYSALFNHNASIRIEPEYTLHPKFSLKIPIVIGLGIQDESFDITYPRQNTDYQYYSTYYFQFYQQDAYPSLPLLVRRNEASNSFYYDDYKDVHKSELLWQVGITPKFYPFGQTRNALYISQSINWGRGNYNSVDYYYEFKDSIYAYTWPDPIVHWNLQSETAVVTKNSFHYFRFETLIGINFNLSSSLCFSIESGFSTVMQNKGTTPDYVYMKVPDQNYQVIYSGVYNVNQNEEVINPNYHYNYGPFSNGGLTHSGKMINRIHLVYKFGGKRIDPKIKLD